MTAFIVPDDDSGRIITFDVIENELHENIAEVTEHPVEVGANVSDHVRPLPDQLSLTAYTSNQPIRVNPFTQRGELISFALETPTWTVPVEATPGSLYRAGLSGLSSLFDDPTNVKILAFSEEFNAIWETYEILREFQTNGVLLQILTGIRTYEDMVLTRVTAPRNAGDSGVAFGLEVRALRIVESGQVTAAPVPADDVPGGKPLENKGGQGAQAPVPGEDEARGGSIAFEILSGQGLI